jgi:hypothetical protein
MLPTYSGLNRLTDVSDYTGNKKENEDSKSVGCSEGRINQYSLVVRYDGGNTSPTVGPMGNNLCSIFCLL